MSPLLAIHVVAGSLAVLAGALALVWRKGGAPHRASGGIFAVSMLVMAATASMLAALKAMPDMFVGGLLAIYLTATAWMTAHRRDGQSGMFEVGACLASLLGALGMLAFAILTVAGVWTAPNPYVAAAYFAFGGVMILAAGADLSVVLRGGLGGRQRIARHLWRMCAALVIAVGAFAGQGVRLLPASWGAQPFLLGVMGLVLGAMAYWLALVLLGPRQPAPRRS